MNLRATGYDWLVPYEQYQIHVQPGDEIPGISPHVGRVGIGFSPTSNWNFSAGILSRM